MSDLKRLRRLLPYLRRDRRRLFTALLLLLPLSIGLLLAAVLFRLALQGSQSFLVQSIGQRLTARLRVDLFRHSLDLSLRFHDRTPVGKLLTRLTSDVDALAEVFGSGAIGVLGDVVTLLVIATLMLTVEWRLALMLLLLQPPLTWLVITLQQRYRKANYRVREELSQLNADLQENLQGLEVVQMFRRERLNSERFGSTNALYRKAVNGTIFFDSSISALLEWVSLAAVALVLAVGGSLVSAEAMGLGVLTTFILYAQRLFDPLRQLAERFTQFQGGLTAVERIGELFDEHQEIVDRGRSSSLQTQGEVIFDDVCFAYRPDEPILQNLNLHIRAGEHVALVGPTGSGKSTVIRLLCRLYEPQQGRILLDGVDIRDLPITTLRKRLGVVLQDTFLFSGSVADNLMLDTQRPRAELEQICADLGLNPLLLPLEQNIEKCDALFGCDALRQHRTGCGKWVKRKWPKLDLHRAGFNIGLFQFRQGFNMKRRTMRAGHGGILNNGDRCVIAPQSNLAQRIGIAQRRAVALNIIGAGFSSRALSHCHAAIRACTFRIVARFLTRQENHGQRNQNDNQKTGNITPLPRCKPVHP